MRDSPENPVPDDAPQNPEPGIRPTLAHAGHAVTASASDIREFRDTLKRARRHGRSALMRMGQHVVDIIPAPFALWQGFVGLYRFGRSVKKDCNIGLSAQYRSLFHAYCAHRIKTRGFYLYQLFLPEGRAQLDRHFSFSELLPMHEFILDVGACEDFEWLRHKHLFAKRCAEVGIPTVPVNAEFDQGKMTPNSISAAKRLPPEDIFAKPSRYWCGIDANLWRYRSSGEYVNSVTGERRDEAGLIRELCKRSKSRRLVVQRRLSNHGRMIGSLTSGALATIRLVSCRSPSGSIDFMPPVIKMPFGRAVVDNFAQGGLVAPIDFANGQICGRAIRNHKDRALAFFDRHPDTGVRFKGLRLPFWNQAVELAAQAHRAFPSMSSVGWDIAILQDGPIVLEGNSTWDVDVTLLPHRLNLADTQFIPYYNYHFRQAHAGR